MSIFDTGGLLRAFFLSQITSIVFSALSLTVISTVSPTRGVKIKESRPFVEVDINGDLINVKLKYIMGQGIETIKTQVI